MPNVPAGGAGDVSDLGEFGLIDAVVRRFAVTPDVLLGPGDDAAVVAAPDCRVVATMDLLVEGRHFRRDWSGAHEIGRKAAAQNLADVVAMGARPTALLVGPRRARPTCPSTGRPASRTAWPRSARSSARPSSAATSCAATTWWSR